MTDMEKMIRMKEWKPVTPDHPALKGAARNDNLYRKEGTNNYLWHKVQDNVIAILDVIPLPKGCYLTAVRYQGRADNPKFFQLLHEMLGL